MSIIRRLILGRRFSTAVPKRAEDIMSNPDCRPSDLCIRVWYLLASIDDVDTAAKYARLAVFSRIKTEDTEVTCENIIAGMLRNKRHKDAYDLYDFFFNHYNLRPTVRCCNYILESRFQQGLVDEALEFHRSMKSSFREDTVRVLTKGLVQSGSLNQALALLKDRKPFDLYPDHVAFNNLVRGFLDLGNVDKANLVLDEFKRAWSAVVVGEDTFDFLNEKYPLYENRFAFLMATFMDYWFKQGKEMEAMECYNHKFLISAETGNALLQVLLKYGNKSHAWALYHEMLDQSGSDEYYYPHLDCDTVEMMVKECFDMGRCTEAIETYNKAKARAKKLALGHRYIIARCCANGMLAEAESLFADSLADGFGFIDIPTYKIMIEVYVKAGRIDDAVKTCNHMIGTSLKELSHLI